MTDARTDIETPLDSASMSSASSITGVTPVAETTTLNEKIPPKEVGDDTESGRPQAQNKESPTSARDPFEVFLTDEESPTSLPLLRKWWIVAVVSTCATCVTCASSMVS